MSDILYLVTTDGEAQTTAISIADQPCRIRVPAGATVETLDETSGKWQPVTLRGKKAKRPIFDWSILDD